MNLRKNENGIATILIAVTMMLVATLVILQADRGFLWSLRLLNRTKIAIASIEISEQMSILIRVGVDTLRNNGGTCPPGMNSIPNNLNPVFCVTPDNNTTKNGGIKCFESSLFPDDSICLDNSRINVEVVKFDTGRKQYKNYVDSQSVWKKLWTSIYNAFSSFNYIDKAYASNLTPPESHLPSLSTGQPTNTFFVPTGCSSPDCVSCNSGVECYRIRMCLKSSCESVSTNPSDWLQQTIGIL